MDLSQLCHFHFPKKLRHLFLSICSIFHIFSSISLLAPDIFTSPNAIFRPHAKTFGLGGKATGAPSTPTGPFREFLPQRAAFQRGRNFPNQHIWSPVLMEGLSLTITGHFCCAWKKTTTNLQSNPTFKIFQNCDRMIA